MNNEMVTEKSWEEFRNTGLLMFINQILHVFGWAIVVEIDEEKIQKVYPARVKFRGFSEDVISRNYIKISEWMNNNSDELLKEAKDE